MLVSEEAEGNLLLVKFLIPFIQNHLLNLYPKNLNKKKVYRLDRVDVKSDFPIPCMIGKTF